MVKKKTEKKSKKKEAKKRKVKKTAKKKLLSAKQLLTSPDLLNLLIAEVQKRVTGETNTIKVLITCISGRLVIESDPLSYNVAATSCSGSGKDKVIKDVVPLVPEKFLIRAKSLTPKVFRYFHTAYRVVGSSKKWKGDLNFSWDGKVFYCEDISDGTVNDEVFKVMLSSDAPFAYAVERQKTIQIRVTGKPVVLVTTASANLNEENLRRFLPLSLDESEEQTRRVIDHTSKQSLKDEKALQPSPEIIEAMKLLNRVRVHIPFVRKAGRYFPTGHVISRSAYCRFLDLIKASAALHQYQRERNKRDEVIATWFDYDVARDIMNSTMTNNLLIPMTGNRKLIWDIMHETEGDYGDWFSAAILVQRTGLKYNNLLEHLRQMVKSKILQSRSNINPKTEKHIETWKPQHLGTFRLPESKDLL
jgi:hypothetical protein